MSTWERDVKGQDPEKYVIINQLAYPPKSSLISGKLGAIFTKLCPLSMFSKKYQMHLPWPRELDF